MSPSPLPQVGPRLREGASKLLPRQARLVELVARGLGDTIATLVSEPTAWVRAGFEHAPPRAHF